MNIGLPCWLQHGFPREKVGGSPLTGVTYPKRSLKQRWQNGAVQRKNSTE